MKKLLLTIISVLFSVYSWAVEVTVDGIKYDVLKKAGSASLVSGRNRTNKAAVNIPAHIMVDGVSCSVVEINPRAFEGCTQLVSVTMPNTVKKVCHDAFADCRRLSKESLPNSLEIIGEQAFYGCESLSSVRIPNSVTAIGNAAFQGCKRMNSLILSTSISEINYKTFSGCSSLKELTLPNSVVSIGEAAFEGCTSLSSLTLSASLRYIYQYAFQDCSNLSTILWNNNIELIGNYSFAGCKSLKSVAFPHKVTSIGNYSFSKCSNLATVKIPGALQIIGSGAFADCEELTDVYFEVENCKFDETIFKDSHVEYATLHVPSQNVPRAKTSRPLKQFGKIVGINAMGDDAPEVLDAAVEEQNISPRLRELIETYNKNTRAIVESTDGMWIEDSFVKDGYLVNVCYVDDRDDPMSEMSEAVKRQKLENSTNAFKNALRTNPEERELTEELVKNNIGWFLHIKSAYNEGQTITRYTVSELKAFLRQL